ncbi:hypothetical protein PRK78_001612 [Emydomyces testavorans]|uniref:DUF1996 domain-containing protein n=1 Tax=Emydomyces testavorans TaxID=2070801 RepID=A0AAF0DD51_9EURO|nr:hypothetical protein PRK78_001612 [Emydomyces testavorans]
MRFNAVALAGVITTMAAPSMAFWRLPCRGVLGVARIDPIMDPGKPSVHVHSIHGGGNFDMDVTRDELLASSCTSCAVVQDKSAYWTPSLYFVGPRGEAKLVNQVGGMLVYYLPRGDNVQAFPKGLRMIAGDTYQRNFTLPVPDPPKSIWTKSDKTQFALGQKALGFNCLNYNTSPEPSLLRHTFPSRILLDSQCKDGLRMELVFPSCWNGKDLDSPDHRSHVAYPDLVDVGSCPEGFEKRIVTLMYETIWDTYAFKGKEGEFVISNGDPTGCGYHGDFIEAWEGDVLERAIQECKNLSGKIEDCPVFKLQAEKDQKSCKFVTPFSLEDEACDYAADGLPGKVPIMRGPGYAKIPIPDSSVDKANPSPPVTDPKLKVPQINSPAPSQPTLTTKPQPIATPPPEAKDVVTNKAAENEKPYTTLYSTNGATVYEIAVVQKTSTKTVDPTMPTSHAKRHEHAHRMKKGLLRHRHARGHF